MTDFKITKHHYEKLVTSYIKEMELYPAISVAVPSLLTEHKQLLERQPTFSSVIELGASVVPEEEQLQSAKTWCELVQLLWKFLG